MTVGHRRVFSRPIGRALLTAAALLALASGVSAAEKGSGSPGPAAPSAEACALLDDPKLAGRMDGLLRYLAIGCGREAEFLGSPFQEGGPEAPDFAPQAADIAVSDPSGDGTGTNAKTQSETSIAYNPVTGTLCASWNDAHHGITGGVGLSGFGRSTDAGGTWDDRGPISTLPGQQDSGDPSLVWRQLDGKFYYAALLNGGLGIYRSDDDCMSFTFVNQFVSGGDDKEIMVVDNSGGSYDGRLYVVWTDFGAGNRIFEIHSADGGVTWSTQAALSAPGVDVQGAWPAVGPNGHVYVAWLAWIGSGWPDGNLEIQVSRSTDGGATWTPVTPPMSNQVGPRDSTASGTCGRPALKGNIRYLPSPQIAIDSADNVHVTYTYDPDGFNTGDVSNVYYRKSTDGGATWQPEVLINDDGGTTDQYQPTLSIGAGNVVTVGYYSRQHDPGSNLLLDYYSRTSFDAGATWAPSVRLSDVSTPVVLDSSPNLAACYHGDYDMQVHSSGKAHYLWSDDRDPDGGGPEVGNPNIYTEFTPTGTDFLPVASVVHRSICFPASTTYPIDVFQFQGFSEPVTMTSSGFPPGYIDGFTTNPVAPGGSTTLEINNTGASAAGDYTITVTGTSSPGGIVRQTAVTLELFVGTPGAPTLTAPADGEIDTARGPVLDWDPQPTAVDYLVEVATDAGFTNIVRSATVAETSWAVSPQLDILTTYHWRVTADNPCGDDVSSTFDFTTANPTILLVDDDDNGPDVQTTYNSLLNAIAVYDIWDTTAQGSEPTALDLAPYQAVIWFSGDAFSSTTPRAGPQAAGETALATYLDSGRCLLLSSQDYLWDNLGSGTQDANPFMATYLGLDSATSDSGDYTSVDGRGFFSTLGNSALSFPYSDFSDELVLGPAAQLAFEGNNLKDGAISKLDGNHFTTFMSFGIETLPEAKRTALIDRFLTVCEAVRTMHVDDFESNSFDRWDAVGAAAP